MTGLYLVNYLPAGDNKWLCAHSFHRKDDAMTLSEVLRRQGHKTRIQTVLICRNGEAHTDLDKALETV